VQSGQIIVNKYRLNRLLGTGGMATVWSATHTFTERQFAIKFMLPSVAKTDETIHRFLQEARVSARIDHPNVIDILDVGQAEDGGLFLVMELLTGVSLETAMRRQSPPLTLVELAFVMVEVARTLAVAHRSGVVHRDLKPSNIFLHKERSGTPVPKILDFGVSKFMGDESARLHPLTVAGTVIGSPLYMSPEQARGDSAVDGRSDVFSFGAMLFEALCGYRPYEAPNFNALIVKIATTAPRNVDDCAPQVPASLRSIVRDCLSPQASQRIEFEEVAERLMAALPELEVANAHVPAPASGMLPYDPDATAALPIIRPSDRPAAYAPVASLYGASIDGSEIVAAGSKTGSILFESTPPSMLTATTNLAHGSATPLPSWRNPTALLIAGGTTFTIVLAAIATAFSVRHFAEAGDSQPRSVLAQSAKLREADPSNRTTAKRSQPALDIRALPETTSTGRLSIVAFPKSCRIAVDGTPRGRTPLAKLELQAGTHLIECVTESGSSRSARVSVVAGASDRHMFPTP
jgi:eukaryotic-like serine/threonine-protein kinase